MTQAILMPNGRQQFFTDDGTPAIGWKIWTYDTETDDPRATYTDADHTVENTNPIVCDSRGEILAYWLGVYKVVVTDEDDNLIYTTDPYTGAMASSSLTAADVSFTAASPHDWDTATNVDEALNEIMDRIDALPAENVTIEDTGGYFTSTNVEGALIELALGQDNALPDQTGHAGEFLSTDGAALAWDPIPSSLPTQTGNAGKYLQTDGSVASWVNPVTTSAGSAGSITLPGGIIMKWGTATVAAATNNLAVPFAVAFPTNCFNVVVSCGFAGSSTLGEFGISAKALTPSGFSIDNSGLAGLVYWQAIGN